MKISETFKCKTTRPLNALDVVGIAELAQFTSFEKGTFPTLVSAAMDELYREWKFEVEDSDLNFTDWNKGRLMFRDGSSLMITER